MTAIVDLFIFTNLDRTQEDLAIMADGGSQFPFQVPPRQEENESESQKTMTFLNEVSV